MGATSGSIAAVAAGLLMQSGAAGPSAQPPPATITKTLARPSAPPRPSGSPTAGPIERPFVPHRDFHDPACYRDTSRERAELCAQWRAAVAAENAVEATRSANTISLVAMILSGLAFVTLMINLKFTRDANNLSRRSAEAAEATTVDARRIGQAQTRCYLSIEAVRIHIAEADGRPRLHVAIRNAGTSPALDVTWAGSMTYGAEDAGSSSAASLAPAGTARESIAPGEVFDMPAVAFGRPVDASERTLILHPQGALAISATIAVSAMDVFGLSVSITDRLRGVIHDFDLWEALMVTGGSPVRRVAPSEATSGKA